MKPLKVALQREFVGDCPPFNPDKAERYLEQVEGGKVGSLERAVGGLSTPSKMPCLAYNLPAVTTCRIGALLTRTPGSVCFRCYAAKGRYVFKESEEASFRRLKTLDDSPELWAAHMVALLRKKKGKRASHFRWHDSGETRGPNHAAAIVWIAERVPNVRFWIPTREYGVWAKVESIPSNLCVRLSAHMVGTKPPQVRGLPTSTVDWSEAPANCPAPKQGGKCLDCRRCWDTSFPNVNYHKH